ncbi:MAG: divergent polysaccharide deacetylase family protein [Treponema sp.]|nr:divergent polysaccharide deacetylase family protein [Treponema sp.]
MRRFSADKYNVPLNGGKKPGAKKNTPRKSRPAKRKSTVKRRKKPGKSDALRAVLLTAALISAAAIISFVFIVGNQSRAGRAVQSETAVLPPETPAENPAPSESPAQPESPSGNAAPSESPAQPAAGQPRISTAPAPESVPARNAAPRNAAPEGKPARPPESAAPVHEPAPVRPPEISSQTHRSQAPAAKPPEKPRPQANGTLVFIIDDAGNNLAELQPFLRFPGPLTIAVLPALPHSAEAARLIRASGKEVFLHQPMEAIGGQPPGPGAIYSNMNDAEIWALLRKNVDEIGPVAGINNHQGSKITMDSRIMKVVLDFCKEQGICFVDSRTTSDTIAPFVAREIGMKIGSRNIFIDNEQSRNSMNKYIDNGLVYAQKNSGVVMIGHAWSHALGPLLLELYPGLRDQGYTFSVASAYIDK